MTAATKFRARTKHLRIKREDLVKWDYHCLHPSPIRLAQPGEEIHVYGVEFDDGYTMSIGLYAGAEDDELPYAMAVLFDAEGELISHLTRERLSGVYYIRASEDSAYQVIVEPDTVLYDIEVTDTFGGEANYSWVDRSQIEIASDASMLAIQRKAKKQIGWNGIPCRVDDWGDGMSLWRRDACQVCFISWHDDSLD